MNTVSMGPHGEGAKGLLQLMPASWLHQLIVTLPRRSRLSLFRVSRQLARQVIRSTPRPCLKRKLKRGYEEPDVAHRVLAWVHDEDKQLCYSVQVHDSYLDPLKPAMYAFVTELQLQWDRLVYHDHVSVADINWSALINLKILGLDNLNNQALLLSMAEALEAGHMMQLSSLKMHAMPMQSVHPWTNTATLGKLWQRVACAVGQRITDLDIHDDVLLQSIQQFVVLQRLQLRGCVLANGSIARWLFEHPTLSDVKLVGCEVRNSLTHYMCTWKRLSIVWCHVPDILEMLPLAGVADIKLDKLSNYRHPQRNVALLKQNIARFRPKLELVTRIWKDRNGKETSVVPCDELGVEFLPLLKLIRRPCVLDLFGVAEGLVPALWQALPPCVWGVRFFRCSDQKRADLLQGLPTTVNSLWLITYEHADNLLALMRTVPDHLKQLTVVPDQKEMLAAAAPAHLSIIADSK